MISSIVLTWAALTVGSSAEELDRAALVRLLDGAQQVACEDVTFEYEGKQFVPGKPEQDSQKLGPDGLRLVYSGTFRRRSDGATLIDIYTVDKKTDRAKHAQVALLRGTTEFLARHADQKKGKIAIRKQVPLVFAGPGNYRKIWLADWVRMFAESEYLYDFLGYQDLDGAECLVVRFRLAYDASLPSGNQVSRTFWIDLNRNGQVVRQEYRWGSDLVGLTTVRLGKFSPEPGRAAWLPVSGKDESRLAVRGGERQFLDEPVYYETYSMIPVTLRFNEGLKDSAFSVKASPGDVVSDELRKAKYEFGQYMVRPRKTTRLPSDAEAKAELDRMLRDSAVMADELKASSPLRDGPGWWSLWPWAVAALSAAGIGMIYLRNRG